MRHTRLINSTMLLAILSFSLAIAQEAIAQSTKSSDAIITASATDERVRFTASSSITQIRLEVYNSSGKKLIDNELRGGNVLDCLLLDEQAARFPDDSYLCVVTVKDLSGRITQKIGSVRVEKASVSVQSLDASQMTPGQTEAVGPVERDSSLILLNEGETGTPTVIAHNGEDGQITRGKGALTFRIGDFFRGKDVEQMRLSAEGNLGIGITNPQVRLDVDGLIRASQGIVFPDGSIQYSAARRTLGVASLEPGQSRRKITQGLEHQELAPESGTGTTGKLPKWQDGPNGILNDSNITDVNGAIGINGSPNTSFRLDVNGSTRIRGSNPGFNLEGLRAAGNIWLFQTVDDDGRFRLFSQDNANPGVERLTIGLSTGNVGIGATNPLSRLDVAGTINTSTQYNIGGVRVLSNAGTFNLFAGLNAGNTNAGAFNSFFGSLAGASNTTGDNNAFFGANAGQGNTTGQRNSFFGPGAGSSNEASNNAFFGYNAGNRNTTGEQNSFFGVSAGTSNTLAWNNSYFGFNAGLNSTSSFNAFFGSTAGSSNTLGDANSFFGAFAGSSNTEGSLNSFFGKGSGNKNTTGNFNSFFGEGAGFSNTTGTQNSFVGLEAGTSNVTGSNNSFVGMWAGRYNTADSNSFFGSFAGYGNTTGFGNSFVGRAAGSSNTTGAHNTLIGSSTDVGSSNLNYATAIGADAIVSTSNTIALGRSDGSDIVVVPGKLQIDTLATAGSTSLCLNGSNRVAPCSSSLRYKTDVEPFTSGLSIINRLQPITFTWIQEGKRDLGLGAEDVAKIEPLLTLTNSKGEIEGVKYNQLSAVFINAFKQQQEQINAHARQATLQQQQIEQYRKQLNQQQEELNGLKRFVCSAHPKAEVCKERRYTK